MTDKISKEKLIEYLKEGLTVPEIARKEGLTVREVKYLKDKYNLKLSDYYKKDENQLRKQIQECMDDGLTIAEGARRLGLTVGRFRYCMRKYGIKGNAKEITSKETYIQLLRETNGSILEVAKKLGETYKTAHFNIKYKYEIDMSEFTPNPKVIAEQKMNKSQWRHYQELLVQEGRTQLICEKLQDLLTPPEFDEKVIEFVPIPKRKKRIKEVMVAWVSDSHVGKKTKTYSIKVFKKRLAYYEKKILRLLELHRPTTEMRELYLCFCGDILDGVNIYPGQAYSLEEHIIGQLKVALDEFSKMVFRLSKSFEKIHVKCTRGNHGRTSKHNHKSINWDEIFYHGLKLYCQDLDGVDFEIAHPDDNYLLTTINGYKFMMLHGDMLKSYMGYPWYAAGRLSQAWKGAIDRDIDYVFHGHFHVSNRGWTLNDIEIFAGGTFVSDDDYTIEKIGANPPPSQLVMGVHSKHG
ncbi:MAG: hypothetical protein ACTSPB_21165, partial [Candidatus Thorarchaeota archaeon]